MPSCAEFGVINQYLSIKDQIDSGFFPDQAEVDIMEKQKQYVDEILWQEDLKPVRSFLDSDTSSWFLEPVMGRLCDLPGPANTTTITATTTTPTSLHNSPTPLSHKTIISGMSGATVTERSAMVHEAYESDDVSCGSSDDSSVHDIYDLDSGSIPPYNPDGFSSSSSSRSPDGFVRINVKMEQQDSWYGGASGESPHQSNGASRPQLDDCYGGCEHPMDDKVVKSIHDEIKSTTSVLCISSNPQKWSPSDTQRWVHHTCLVNQFPTSCVPMFNMKGSDLCQRDMDDFKKRSTDQIGTFLHQSLDIMKMVQQIQPDTPVEDQSAFFSSYLGGEKPLVRSVDPYHTTSPSPSTGSQSSASSEEDAFMAPSCQPPQAASRNAPNHVSTPHRGARPGKQTIHLWQFLRELLDDPENYQSCIKWLDRSKGIFKIEDSSKVAKFWGKRKNRPAMNYDKLSRSVRQYYKKGIIRKTEMSKRLVYQFCTPYL